MAKSKRVAIEKIVARDHPPLRPTHVKVGAFDYRILTTTPMDSEREGRWGHHHFGSLEIGIQANLPLQQQAHILQHELLHACWKIANLPPDNAEEEFVVTGLAMAMAAIWRDNPSLFRWFNFALHSPE